MNKLQKIIFVYNAQSGFMHSMTDLFNKTAKPDTYDCKLCQLTYSGAFMKKVWKQYVDSLGIKTVFMHKDEFKKAYPTFDTTFPVILLETYNSLSILVSSSDFKKFSDIAELMSLLSKRLKAIGSTNKKQYKCPECGLYYTDKITAKKCEAWCKEYKSCNLEITKLSVEVAGGLSSPDPI